MNDHEYDDLEIRCPKLGHQLCFSYCCREQNELPCSRSLKCWEGRFPAGGYFKKILTPAQWERCFESPPPPKMSSLMELIERAKKVDCEKG